MDPELRKVGEQLSCKPRPVKSVVSVAGHDLPADYIEFIHEFNSAEGGLGRSEYVALWPVEELDKLNNEYEVKEYWPGVLLFGSNGGGMGYGFDFGSDGPSIRAIPFDSIDPEDSELLASTFTVFLLQLGCS